MLPRRRVRQRRRLILLGCLIAFGLYSLFGFFGLPPIIKVQTEKRLGAMLHRPVAIGHVSVNPYTLALTMEQFAIREPDGKNVFIVWDRLYVQFEILCLFGKEWRFVAIELNGPSAEVVVNPDGSLNFSDLLNEMAAPGETKAAPPAAPGRPLHVKKLLLTGARLVFRDQSRAQPFTTTLGPVGLRVADFRTLGGQQAPYSFEAVTESGEKFSWQGWMEAAPFRSGGELGVTNLVLKKYAPYYAEKLGVDLVDGRLTVRGKYEVNFGEKNPVMKLIDGSLDLRNLKLVERASGETLLELSAADIIGATADGLTLEARVKEVALKGGRLNLRREADGVINLTKLTSAAAPAPVGVAAPGAVASTAPLALRVDEMALQDWTLLVTDLAAPRPVHLGLNGLNATLKNFTLAEGAQMPVELDFNWQPQGKLHVAGQFALKPIQADLTLKADGLALAPLASYLDAVMEARLTDGLASTTGHATLVLRDDQPPALTFAGDAWLERLDLVTGSPGVSFAGFSDLVLNGIAVTTEPQFSFTLAEVNLNAPYTRVLLDRDGTLNIAKALTRPAGKTAPVATTLAPVMFPGAAATGPSIEVGRVVINNGDFNFTDRSVSPQVRVAVNKFGGTLAGWSSLHPGRGEADLKAMVDGVGPVAITGKFDPLGAAIFVDGKVEVARVDLQPISPYVGKFAGYELARGKLSVDVQAKIADRQVDMANVITLDQFTLGRATNSPDATKLPVRLGVALLKDIDGKIELDVPVQGSLDDPNFRISKVVWRVIGNLLTKVAVSPFALMGSMFGGGGEELSYQEFAPGETTLSAESLAKLSTLVKALEARPGLNVAIEGNFDEAADSFAMKQVKMLDDMRQAVWEEKFPKESKRVATASVPGGKGKPSPGWQTPVAPVTPTVPVPPAEFVITPEERTAMVKKLFDRRFPPGTKFGTPLPPPPFVQPPPPRPPGGFVRRVIDFVTWREQREKDAFTALQKQVQEEYLQQVQVVAAAGLPQEEMEGRLAEALVISPDDLHALAADRAQTVRDYLINVGKIAPERLFLTQPEQGFAPPEAGDEPAPVMGPRVFLELQ